MINNEHTLGLEAEWFKTLLDLRIADLHQPNSQGNSNIKAELLSAVQLGVHFR